jgi:hypothetical protein
VGWAGSHVFPMPSTLSPHEQKAPKPHNDPQMQQIVKGAHTALSSSLTEGELKNLIILPAYLSV